MEFDFSWVPTPTKEQLAEEGANHIVSSAAGPYPGYRTLNDETKKKISESLKGNIPWNKGKKGLQKASEETRKKLSESHKKYHTEEERLAARRESWRKSNEKKKREGYKRPKN